MKILYLENHAIFARQVIGQFLTAHSVTVVSSLAAARAAFTSDTYDLILADFDLDDGKGDEFVRECRLQFPVLPIIAASAHETGNAALKKAGASAVCGKMDFDGIQQVIDSLKDRRD